MIDQTTNNTDSPNLNSEREEALEAIRDQVLSIDRSNEIAEESENEIDWEAANARLTFENRLEKKARRERWDTTLLLLVVVGFGSSFWIILLIGLEILKFENNAFAVPSVVAAGIVQTYGLSKLAIKYFFTEDGDDNGEKEV
jgi:hypothetical protein